MFVITDAARAQMKKNMADSEAEAIKIALKRSGCSGYMYYLDFCQEVDPELVTIEESPVHVVTEEKTLPYLANVTLDYIQEGLNRSFKFSNPDAKGECGCGDSFMF